MFSNYFKLPVIVCFLTLMINVSGYSQCTAPAAGCSNTDFSNSFLNSSSPNTIEYDNMVSTFHSTLSRQADGRVLIWGEKADKNGVDHVRTPRELNSTNYPLTGSILRFTAGSRDMYSVQYCVLTTNGLYVWGAPGILVSTAVKTTEPMGSINLPAGVSPGDVKMLFGSYKTLVIVTCNGAVWVLSAAGLKNGDNTTDQGNWHRVKTNQSGNPFLSDVVAVRGSTFSLMALKSDGTIWTWGERCYLGNGTDMAHATYATPMPNLPGTPKMIGMTQSYDRRENTSIDKHTVTYYMLTTTGRIYSLGSNRSKELGAFLSYTTVPFAEQKNWVQVQKTAAAGDYLTNVAWISPQEHDGYYAAINILTFDGKVYSWGVNALDMIGLGSTYYNDPTPQPSGINATDKIMAVESGGHTTILVKQCTGNYGYVGHKVNGSMGDGSFTDATVPAYSFSTASLNMCAAQSGAAVLFPVTGNTIANNTPVQLNFAPAGGVFSVTGPATISNSGMFRATGPGTITVNYGVAGACASTSSITLTSTAAVLPVTFGAIDATLENNQLAINWNTLKETNNSHFEIEASVDGSNFSKIGEIKTKAMEGNSSEELNYEFSTNISGIALAAGLGLLLLGGAGILNSRKKYLFVVLAAAGMAFSIAGCNKEDNTVIGNDGKLFVRIAQVDKDGTKMYSKIVKAGHH